MKQNTPQYQKAHDFSKRINSLLGFRYGISPPVSDEKPRTLVRGGSLTAHCLVKNEQNWVWFAINSVLDFVDKIIVFDTGSTDDTVPIIKTIRSPKIKFSQKGPVDKKQLTRLRQEMLDQTKTSWFMVLDGDEIWPRTTIAELTAAIRQASSKQQAIVVGQWMWQGDVYHYSPVVEALVDPLAPKNLTGYRLPRAIKMLPGIQTIGEYGWESYADQKNLNVSDWNKERLIYIKNKFFHASFLPRSSTREKDREVMMRGPKTRFTKGALFPKNVILPEILSAKRPQQVPSPWQHLTLKQAAAGFYYRAQNLVERFGRQVGNL